MDDPRSRYLMTFEERWREDYETMEKYAPKNECELHGGYDQGECPFCSQNWGEPNWLEAAAELARKEARKVKADKIIEFLRRPENARKRKGRTYF